MNNKQEDPKRKDLQYHDVESLLLAFGAIKHERSGSRVNFELPGEPTRTFSTHKPHGRRENTLRAYVIKELRDFLNENNLRID